jgi:hypothetical protein
MEKRKINKENKKDKIDLEIPDENTGKNKYDKKCMKKKK